MNRFYAITLAAFGSLKALALTLHYFSPSPWGGPLVLRPDRFLPDALLIELGLLALLVLAFGIVERSAPARLVSTYRAVVVSAVAFYSMFGQVDLEVVRWLGQHMNLSYIRNFIGARDAHMAQRIISGDPWWTGLSVGLAVVPWALAAWVWARRRGETATISQRSLFAWAVLGCLLATAPAWLRPSEKRWRRIRPGVLVIAQDAVVEFSGWESPRHPAQARADLLALVNEGHLSDTVLPDSEANEAPDAPWPLWQDDNVGHVPLDHWLELPLEDRPDVILIVFETMRGWNTGQVPSDGIEEGTPEINAFMEGRSVFFPYMHSAGFPSVEGCMGMHLGIWPHFRKIIFSDFLHTRTLAFPEILRQVGYSSEALLGADPSFSNFTPWLERWYDRIEYTPSVHHDGPLVDRFIEIEEQHTDEPRLLMLWTATTHPPYDLPESEGIAPAADNESRFAQAIRYSDREIARLLRHLESQPEWDRTVVLMLGDHAQPTPDQWLYDDRVGPLNPGHTWTHLYITGGWHGVPAPTRFEGDVSHVDLAPTVLGLLNLQASNHFMGRNLVDALEEPREDRPVLSFRYGDIAWQMGTERLNFRLTGDSVMRWSLDRADAVSYGQLDPENVIASTGPPEGVDLLRLQDAVRSWGRLLETNALIPPAVSPPETRR
jgi:hypothetical protein